MCVPVCLEDFSVIVIELGSQWIKAGYAGEETPRLLIPAHLGNIYPRCAFLHSLIS
jgi:actin-related protein